MSESTHPQDNLIENSSGAAPAGSQHAPSVADLAEHGAASAPGIAMPAAPPADPRALLELIGLGLAPEADDATRAAARELWAQCAQSLTATVPVTPPDPLPAAAPVVLPAPLTSAVPVMPTTPVPTSPIGIAARALRQLPPDQLLDLLLQRLRTALPTGATVPTPRGIQFQLVPVTQPPGSR